MGKVKICIFGLTPPSSIHFIKLNSVLFLLLLTYGANKLGILNDSWPRPSVQINAVVTEAREIHAFLKRTFRQSSFQIFILLNSVKVFLHLEYCAQAKVPCPVHSIASVKLVQQI